MNIGEFNRQVSAAREQFRQRNDPDGHDGDLDPFAPSETVTELHTAYEELRVAGEELNQQFEELIETREELEAEKRRYKELFEFAPDGYIVTRTDGKIIKANRAASALFRVDQSSLIGKPLAVYVAESERRAFRSFLGEMARATSARLLETRIQSRHGPAFEASLSVDRMVQDGKTVGMRWLVRDVSGVKRQESVSRRSAVLLRAGQILSRSLDPARLLSQVVSLPIPQFADLCSIYVPQTDVYRGGFRIAHRDPEISRLLAAERRNALDLSSDHPAAFVMRTGKRRLALRVDDQTLNGLAGSERELEILRSLRIDSLLSLPLRARGRLGGAITFCVQSPREYGPEDLPTAEWLTRQIAMALDNARLYQEWQRIRAHGERNGPSETGSTLAALAHLSQLLEEQLGAGDSDAAQLTLKSLREQIAQLQNAEPRLASSE